LEILINIGMWKDEVGNFFIFYLTIGIVLVSGNVID
jgi:hypothetical protein